MDTLETLTPATVDRFPSLAALRAAHSSLLQAQRSSDEANGLSAKIAAFIQQGQATGALLDNVDERAVAQSVLDYWSTMLYRTDQTEVDALLDDFDPALAPELADELCPYKGLDAFRENDGSIFFGRQYLTERLINRLRADRFLAVVGPSGSGKSSLVLAGLLPMLKNSAIPPTDDSPGSQHWRYAPRMVPGSNPLANLARILHMAGIDDDNPPNDENWFAEQVAHLAQDNAALGQMVNTTDNAPSVLLVDQFEEIFTLCSDESMRSAFVHNLITLVQSPGLRHTVIITMRTDFEPQIPRLPGFQPLFEQAVVHVPPLSAAELRQAIEEPAVKIGLRFEVGLIEQLLQDVLGEPAALPLLQFTLLKLWEQREHNRITWDTYKRLGGGRQALAHSADELYESLIPEEQTTARRSLLRLVRPTEGLEVMSNRVRVATLYQSGEARDRVERVLQKLVNARLLRVSEGDISADTQVEVAHEALIRNWPRLGDWLETAREALRQHRRLSEAAEHWKALDYTPGALLTDALLSEAERIIRENELALNELEQAFMAASHQHHETEQQRELARQVELAQAQASAAAEQQRALDQAQSAQLFSRLAIVMAILTLLAIGTMSFALVQRRNAQNKEIEANNSAQAARIAEQKVSSSLSYLLANKGLALMNDMPDTGLLLGWKAHQTAQTAKTWETLLTGIRATGQSAKFLRGFEEEPGLQMAVFSPSGRFLATTTDPNAWNVQTFAVTLWNTDSGTQLWQARLETKVAVDQLVFSPKEELLVTGDADGVIQTWRVADGKPFGQPLVGHSAAIQGLAFSADGQSLASGGDDGTVRIWDLSNNQQVDQFMVDDKRTVHSVALSQDGRWLATGLDNGDVLLWAIADHKTVAQWTGVHHFAVTKLVFGASDSKLMSLSSDGLIAWRDLPSGNIQRIDLQPCSYYQNPVSSADGMTQACRSYGYPSQIVLRSTETGQEVGVVGGESYYLRAISNDRRKIALLPRILSLDASTPAANLSTIPGSLGWVRASAITRDGKTVALGLYDGAVMVKDYTYNRDGYYDQSADMRKGEPLLGHTVAIASLAFSNDGKLLASGDISGTVQVWDLNTLSLLGLPLHGGDAAISTLLFSRNGQRLVVKDSKGVIEVWEIHSGQMLARVDTGISSSFADFALNPEGTVLVWAAANEVRQLDVAPGQPSGQGDVVGQHQSTVLSLGFSPDSRTLASGGVDGVVYLWDMKGEQTPITLSVTTDPWMAVPIQSLDFDASGGRLVTAGSGESSVIRIWDVSKKRQIIPFDSQLAYPQPNGSSVRVYFATGALPLLFLDGAHTLFASRNGYESPFSSSTPIFVGNWINVATLTKSGQRLALGTSAGTISLWDMQSMQPYAPSLTAHSRPIQSLAFRPDGDLLASADASGEIKLWEVATSKQHGTSLTDHDSAVQSLAFSQDGKRLVSGDEKGRILLWDVASGKSVDNFALPADTSVQSLALSPDGHMIVAGGSNSTPVIWDVESGLRIDIGQSASSKSWASPSVAFNSSGGSLATSAPETGEVFLWNVKDRKAFGKPLLGNLFQSNGYYGYGFPTGLQELLFSPDEQKLALSTSDYSSRAVVIWNLASPPKPQVPPLSFGVDDVVAMSFGADSKTLTIIYRNGTILQNYPLPDPDTVDWQQIVCQIANQNLSWKDWNDYIGEDVPYEPVCPGLSPDPSVLDALTIAAQPAIPAGQIEVARAKIAEELPKYPALEPVLSADDLLQHALVQLGQEHARTGEFAAALDAWRQAFALKTTSKPQLQLEPLTYLDKNSPQAVLQFLRDVNELDPGIMPAPEAEIALAMIKQGEKFVNDKKYTEALAKLQEASEQDSQLSQRLSSRFARIYQGICRDGSIAEQAEIVLPACDRAVDLAQTDSRLVGAVHDARGVVRALVKNYAWAIEDFQVYLDWALKHDAKVEEIQLREQWIEQLKADQNPFDAETLQKLKNE